ncbi:MAG TPA: galactokinase [Bacteriovoracaceae bacterium]|nr:galactokinase [Bacteriovoracaceae bacterium]
MTNTFTEKAHGRVNLIGEHTDYNGGWVLPTSIPQFTQVALIPGTDKTVKITSSADPKKGERREFSYQLGAEKHTDTWVDYLQGGTKLLSEFCSKRGETLLGFSAHIESSIPEGSGLSSSAALEISFLKALRAAFKLSISDVEIAQLGQRIENEFVGARVGIMDQMACSLATAGEAIFLDTKALTFERIGLDLDQMDMFIINSGISHRLSAGGGYNQRRAECEEACKMLQIKELRDISVTELKHKDLPQLLMKRARHVVTENARVFDAVAAIRSGDYKKLGKLFVESHASMRDDYEVSIPEIDTLVELCLKDPAVFGARLTGGGFGGSIVAIARKGEGQRVANEVIPQYQKLTGSTATLLAH